LRRVPAGTAARRLPQPPQVLAEAHAPPHSDQVTGPGEAARPAPRLRPAGA
jgi:hypothetical protein